MLDQVDPRAEETAQARATAFLGGSCRHAGLAVLNGLTVLVPAHGHGIHPFYAHTLVAPVVTESDSPNDFDHLIARTPRDLSRILSLVPQLPLPRDDRSFALAVVQATDFPGCSLCLDVSIHHAACDGAPRPSSTVSASAAAGGANTDGDGVVPAATPPDRLHQRGRGGGVGCQGVVVRGGGGTGMCVPPHVWIRVGWRRGKGGGGGHAAEQGPAGCCAS